MGAKAKAIVAKILPAAGSIRRRIFFLFGGIGLGAFLIANLIWLPSVTQEIFQNQVELRHVSVQLVRDQIRQYLEDREEDLRSTAQRFRPSLVDRNREDLRLTAQRLLQTNPAFEEVGILDENGKELFRLSRRIAITDRDLVDRSDSSLFREGMKHEIYWGRVMITETSEPWATLAVRLPGSDPFLTGLVFGVINLKLLWNLTQELKLSHEGRVYIVEEKGRLIAAADPSIVLRRLSFADRPLIQRLINPQKTDDRSFLEDDYVNESGVNVTATGLLLAGPRWGVVIEQPRSVLLAPIRQKVWFFAGLSFVGLMLSFGVARTLSRRLTGPIIRLQEGVEQIGGGNLDYKVSVETGDEIGEFARQFNRMAEQLSVSQRATLSALTIPVISHTGELQKVLNEVISKVMNLTGAEAASLRLIDDEDREFVLSVYQGFSETYARERPTRIKEEVGGGKILKVAEPFISEDLTNDSRGNWHPLAREGFRSAVCVPLKTSSKPFGIMTLASREPGRLSSKQANLFIAIGHQISVALQSARLFQETERNLERLKALRQIDEAISSTLDLRSVLRLFLEKIDALLPYSCATTVRLLSQDSGKLERVASRNINEKEWDTYMTRGGSFTTDALLQDEAPLIVTNLQTDRRTRDPEFFRREGLVSFLGIPLIAKGEALGVLSFYTKEEHRFSDEEIEFLTTLAGQAAIAICNSLLYEQTKRQAEDLKASNDALIRANKVKDEFLSVMSHELRTPLTAVVGYAELMKDRMFGEITPEQEKALERVMMRSADLLSMINGMLQVTQLEASAVEVQAREVGLKDFLDDLKLSYALPLRKEVRMTWDYPLDFPVLKTDSQKLRHILQNLINNAIKFTEKGAISVSAKHLNGKGEAEENMRPLETRNGGGVIEFKVADTGVGIPKEMIPVVFEMFRQVDSSETRLYGGVGLGLYIVKKYTEALGGNVEVESEVGKGSTFTVTIPCES